MVVTSQNCWQTADLAVVGGVQRTFFVSPFLCRHRALNQRPRPLRERMLMFLQNTGVESPGKAVAWVKATMTAVAAWIVPVFAVILSSVVAQGLVFQGSVDSSMQHTDGTPVEFPNEDAVGEFYHPQTPYAVAHPSARMLSTHDDTMWFNKHLNYPAELVIKVLSESVVEIGNLTVNATAEAVPVYCSTNSPYLSIQSNAIVVSRLGLAVTHDCLSSNLCVWVCVCSINRSAELQTVPVIVTVHRSTTNMLLPAVINASVGCGYIRAGMPVDVWSDVITLRSSITPVFSQILSPAGSYFNDPPLRYDACLDSLLVMLSFPSLNL